MSAIETLRMKLLTGEYVYTEPSLKLKHDDRYGTVMPYVENLGAFLEDARRKDRAPPAVKDEARWRAKVLFYSTFMWECPDHGLAMFHTATGKCSLCYKESKRKVVPERAAATGPTYMYNCGMHGHVEHSTARGLCLSCYNTLGQPRPKSTNPKGYYLNREGVVREAP